MGFDLILFFGLLAAGYLVGSHREKSHYRELALSEKGLAGKLVLSGSLPLAHMQDARQIGLATGGVSISVDAFKRFWFSMRGLFGGSVSAYESIIDRAKRQALVRLMQSQPEANAFVGVHYEFGTLGGSGFGSRKHISCMDVIAYGTALRIRPELIGQGVSIATGHDYNRELVSPFRDLGSLTAMAVGLVVAIYLALGFAIDATVDSLPADFGVAEMRSMPGEVALSENTALQDRARKVFDAVLPHTPSTAFKHKVVVSTDQFINAFALPNGGIVISEGLMKVVDDDRQLAFVIGHELGHFVNRDHLRGLGRKLVLGVALGAVIGGNPASDTVARSGNLVSLNFGRQQELAADKVGIDALLSLYGQADPAITFFSVLKSAPAAAEMFSSHPVNQSRIDAATAYLSYLGR